jgi:hypothetical protein
MFVLGLAANFIPTAVFTLAPGTMPNHELAGLSLAILTAGSNLGVLLGPPAAGPRAVSVWCLSWAWV